MKQGTLLKAEYKKMEKKSDDVSKFWGLKTAESKALKALQPAQWLHCEEEIVFWITLPFFFFFFLKEGACVGQMDQFTSSNT